MEVIYSVIILRMATHYFATTRTNGSILCFSLNFWHGSTLYRASSFFPSFFIRFSPVNFGNRRCLVRLNLIGIGGFG